MNRKARINRRHARARSKPWVIFWSGRAPTYIGVVGGLPAYFSGAMAYTRQPPQRYEILPP
ncbi:MAG: hypothetical protein K2W80_11325 [Burkholderiales bacterium]|nr:hypothetical protein [Burkholderiales bacterium]